MAILKSRALQLEEETHKLQQENADTCYAIIDGWEAKVGRRYDFLSRTSTEPPRGKVEEMDSKPFGYCYGALPSRNANTFKRWAED